MRRFWTELVATVLDIIENGEPWAHLAAFCDTMARPDADRDVVMLARTWGHDPGVSSRVLGVED